MAETGDKDRIIAFYRGVEVTVTSIRQGDYVQVRCERTGMESWVQVRLLHGVGRVSR